MLWTGPAAGPSSVDAFHHPPHSATPGHYELDPAWVHVFWVELGQSRRSIRAQVHTHLGPAFHSLTDDSYPIVHMPGFLSLVVPFGAMVEPDEAMLWLAEIDERGRWRRIPVRERLDLV